jgi:hypothetical protein
MTCWVEWPQKALLEACFGGLIDGRSSRTMVRFAVSRIIFSSSSSYANDSQPIWVCCCLGREALNDMLGGMATEGGVGGGFGGLIDGRS